MPARPIPPSTSSLHMSRATLSAPSRQLPVEPPNQALPASICLSQPRAAHLISSGRRKRRRKNGRHGDNRLSAIACPPCPRVLRRDGYGLKEYCTDTWSYFSSSQRFPSRKTAISGEIHTLAAQQPRSPTEIHSPPMVSSCRIAPFGPSVHCAFSECSAAASVRGVCDRNPSDAQWPSVPRSAS